VSHESDVIVVGSGPAGVHAALPLVEAGVSVTMLDVGNEDERYAPLVPDLPFGDMRRSERAQHRFLLGDELEGLPLGSARVGAQLTPPRGHVLRDVPRLTPLVSGTFRASESLALGGLGAAWGASAVRFDAGDLAGFPLSEGDLAVHYEAVASEIGISGSRDDLLRYYGECASLLPPLEADPSVTHLLRRYAGRRTRANRRGLYLGHPRLAVLSRAHAGRSAQSYHDLDFYSDRGRSVWRPAVTLDRLRGRAAFSYARPWLVERFDEPHDPAAVVVLARDPKTGERAEFRARRLVLAAGTLGTARIVLRSLGLYDTPRPIVSNPHVYVPCLQPSWIGRPVASRRHSLTQAGLIFDPPAGEGGLVYGEVHVYGSLLLFKLVRESSLPMPQALGIVRELLSALAILVLEHADEPAADKSCTLRRSGPAGADALHVDYREPDAARFARRRTESALLAALRRLGCHALGRIDTGPGSSIHYAGTFPMAAGEVPLSVDRACRLRGTRAVYLCDGSFLPRLPAKPLTLTLMANARRVASELLREVL
jgi:choline dehydrogenase-like flavoprotein